MQTLAQRRSVESTPPYLPIQVDSLRIDMILNFDLYIFAGRELILYRAKSLPFTERTRTKLIENSISQIYIPYEAKEEYQKYIEAHLPEILNDPKIEEAKKATILYDTSKALIKEVLSNPTYSENIRRSQSLVENTVSYILKGREAFLSLLRISSFDYYTYTHSVNVCTFSLSLARQLQINDRYALMHLGTGALLHDIGKSKVPERILNKRTTLNRSEFEIMKRHPQWGAEILRDTELIAEESYYPVLQHHERFDGTGYPHGVHESDLHPFSKIVSIADVFDALTTQRVYQSAIETYPALRMMHNMDKSFDPAFLKEFTILMGPDSLMNKY
jgi:putative nucleotidyltransferase with HDIG domain